MCHKVQECTNQTLRKLLIVREVRSQVSTEKTLLVKEFVILNPKLWNKYSGRFKHKKKLAHADEHAKEKKNMTFLAKNISRGITGGITYFVICFYENISKVFLHFKVFLQSNTFKG